MKLLFIFLFIAQIIAAQNFKVTFQVNAPAISDTDDVYIAGSQTEFGNWNPSAVKLDRVDNETWRKSFSFPKGTILEYKFTRGAWDNEALNEKGSIPQNHVLKVTKDTLIIVRINKWRDEGVVNENFSGQITSSVK